MNAPIKMTKNLSKMQIAILFVGLLAFVLGIPSVSATSGNSPNPSEQQQAIKSIEGRVTDQDGEPFVGVTVALQGTTVATSTDANGNYKLSFTSASPTLVFSYIGYASQSISVNTQTTINVTMLLAVQDMEDVVVIGYGVVKKSDVTGAISSIKADALMRQPVSNVAMAMQGQVPGVSVTSNSGAPGGSVSVRIRGIGTVNNSDPLYVVDGMPVSNIDYLSSADIQSMELLKDASATAIYGARGANGVVLITTKRGVVGKTTVSLDAYYGLSKIINNMDLLNGAEWYDMQKEINLVRGTKPIDLTKVDRNTSTNWMDEITRTAAIQNYNLTISGGRKDDYNYNLGIGYINQEGTLEKTDFQRLSIRQNVDKTLIKDHLIVGVNMNISQTIKNKILEGSNTVGIINSAIKLEPVIPVRDKKGAYGFSPYIDYNNPVADIDFTNSKTEGSNIVGNVYAALSFFNDFKFRTSFGADIRKTDDYDFVPVYRVSSYQVNPVSLVTRGYTKFNYYVVENTLTYNKTFAQKHTLDALLGYTREWGRTETLIGSKKNTLNDVEDQQYIDAALDPKSATAVGGAEESALLSYLGRVNYDYDNRYLVTASIRRDGSSRFGANNRYGNFPSAALGWKVANESFFKKMDLKWVSSLKLRAGWGRIGNQSIDNYMYQNLLSSNIQYAYLFGQGANETLNQGFVAVAMGNENVKWETTETSNIGLDANILNGRLTFSGEYYFKETKDMLIKEPIPNYFGFETGPMVNIGNAENKGVEFNVDWRDKAGAFNYNVGFNISTISNKMTSIGSGLPIVGGVIKNGSVTRTAVGDPIGAFYGYVTNGLVQTAEQLVEVEKLQPNAALGDVVFVDTDKNGKLENADKKVIGSPIPDFIYGINLGAEWKGFDINIQLGGTAGNDIFNAMRYFTYDLSSVTNKDKATLNYWRPDNTNTTMPRLAGADVNDNMRISDRYVEDGSYMRLRNLQVGYTFPTALAKKMYLQKMRVYITGQNLLTFTNYTGPDPEIGQLSTTNYLSRGVDIGNYPQAMTITGGVSITF